MKIDQIDASAVFKDRWSTNVEALKLPKVAEVHKISRLPRFSKSSPPDRTPSKFHKIGDLTWKKNYGMNYRILFKQRKNNKKKNTSNWIGHPQMFQDTYIFIGRFFLWHSAFLSLYSLSKGVFEWVSDSEVGLSCSSRVFYKWSGWGINHTTELLWNLDVLPKFA